MNITSIRVEIIPEGTVHKEVCLVGAASFVIDDCFIIKDVKILRDGSGLFVAFPSRRVEDRCPYCGRKVFVLNYFCGGCGAALQKDRARIDERGKLRVRMDTAHPLNRECRERLQGLIVKAYEEEVMYAQLEDRL